MQLDEYVSIIKETLSGKGNWEEVMGSDATNQESEASVFFSLTPRQRSIMALASEGANAQDISAQLDMSYAYVRKELSRAYKILLPNVDQTADLRTAAVLRYLELLRL
jgi:DNA-binding NarL/FixJ family response regulator